MRIVADCGSTSCDLAFIENNQASFLTTNGYNPITQAPEKLTDLIEFISVQTAGENIDKIHFYGSGIIDEKVEREMKRKFQTNFQNADINMVSDLLAAARATCGTDPGIVCILGTGSNACLYDGKTLHFETPSLGFILGDEGGGVDIGKRLIQEYFYRNMPEELAKKFKAVLPGGRIEFLTELHKHSQPNQYLASFFTFAAQNAQSDFIQDIVNSAFISFVDKRLAGMNKSMDVHAVGGVVNVFKANFRSIIEKAGFKCGRITKKLITSLAAYHINENL